MRVIAYARVSTEEQAKEGLSLQLQTDRMASYCEAHDHVLLEVLREQGSGSTLKRPLLAQALSQLEAGKADALLVYKLDRLTRSVGDFAILLDSLPALLSVKDNLDTTTAAGRMVTNIMMSVSQWERETISERTKDALAGKIERGERIGRPPVGWSVIEGVLVTNDRYWVVEQAHEYRDQGMTINEIVAAFDVDGIPTGSGRGHWHKESVCRLLRSPRKELAK